MQGILLGCSGWFIKVMLYSDLIILKIFADIFKDEVAI